MKNKIGLLLLITFSLFGLITNIYIHTDKELENVSKKLIRLHVVANSDSPEDQALKLQVRDEVIKKMSNSLEGLSDIDLAKKEIQGDLGKIEAIAKSVLDKNNKDYAVKAELGNYDFPTKVYGNLTLPAGNYQALNIIIGSGKGKNWWCVMFPPLCFIDIAHGVVPEKTTEVLKNSLTEEEYSLLVSAKTEEQIPVKVKFKILEIAKSMNLKLAKLGIK